MSTVPTTAREIASAVRAGDLLGARGPRRPPRRHRRPRGRRPRLQPGDARRRPPRRGERRSTRRGRGGPGSPGRRAGRPEGQPLHQGRGHHLLEPHPRRLAPALRRHGRHPPRRRRRRGDRQDQPRRVRHGLVHRELGLRPDPQPARPHTRARRLVGRFGCRRRGRVRPGVAGQRHRRLDPPARRPVRGGRGEAHLRVGEPLRADGLRLVARSDRAVLHDGGRLGAGARGHRWPRPPRLDLDRPAPGGRSRTCSIGGSRDCGSDWSPS